MNIKRFEDLEIWQEARILCKKVFEITDPKPETLNPKPETRNPKQYEIIS